MEKNFGLEKIIIISYNTSAHSFPYLHSSQFSTTYPLPKTIPHLPEKSKPPRDLK